MNENKIKCNECNKIFNSKLGFTNHSRNGCATINFEKLKKQCPICNDIIKYQCESLYKKSIKNNSKCRKCSNIGRTVSSQTKSKIANTLIKKYDLKEITANMEGTKRIESREKSANTRRGKKLSKIHIEKITNSMKNSEKFKNFIESEKFKLHLDKIQKSRIGTKHSISTRNKMRISSINKIKDVHGKCIPSFNKNGCEYFNKLMLENKCNIQHALNGGEYYIKELGYWLDGYDKENNIAYEWDEKRHFDINGNLKQKDINRQREIEDFLKCKFVRIKETDII